MFRFKVHRLAKSLHTLAGVSTHGTKLSYAPTRTFVTTTAWRAAEGGKVPDNFYDEDLEIEKEFDDIRSSLMEGGISKLTVTKHVSTKKGKSQSASEVAAALADDGSDSDLEEYLRDLDEFDATGDEEPEEVEENLSPEELEKREELKYAQLPDPILSPFIPATSSDRYLGNEQGLRACPGKLQRRGKFPKLECHLIDLDELSYLDVVTLKEFMSDDGEILPKTATGLCSKCQRQVAKTIKTARNFALLPHIGTFELKDGKPQLRETRILHDASPPGAPRVQCKSLL